jgi:NAD+ synthase (glutamine-hydrolysing)
VEDAHVLASNLGIRCLDLSISDAFAAFGRTLAESFSGRAEDTTEENLQARIRGTILMALSNKFGEIVLTTGNKSEMSVGYATLYGDMAGGFAVIKDVFKTMVYRVSRRYNGSRGRDVIPARVLAKPPSAELRPDQKDSDSLPEYDLLDPILKMYVEEDKSVPEMVAAGYPEDVVRRVVTLVDRSEYKRRQAPPGVKITPRALGKDRRMPITNRSNG